MKLVRKTLVRLCAVTVFCGALYACGSSGGGISGTSLVIGSLSAFGSIVVNEITFDTDRAAVRIEGDRASLDDLRLGMIVRVRGNIDPSAMTGVAFIVASDHLLQGALEGINLQTGALTALGQLILTDDRTVFDGATLGNLSAGDNIEVFGYFDSDRNIRATRVERKDSIREIELTGRISNLDLDAKTFNFGILVVDFSSARVEGGLASSLADGLLVEADTITAPLGDVMIATGIDLVVTGFDADEGDDIEVEGFVTELTSLTEFVLSDGQRIVTTPETVFERGTAADLVLDARIEVEGVLDAGGRLTALEVEFF